MSDIKSKLYGRKWKIVVARSGDDDGALVLSDSNFGLKALRAVFVIDRQGYQAFNYGDIKIYNLNSKTESWIIEEGNKVIISAGYVNGAYGKIFEGRAMQVLRDRDNVVDYTLTLHCIDGLYLQNNNIVKFTLNAGSDQRGNINKIAAMASTPIPLGFVTDDISKKTLPRGKVFFGEPRQYLRDIALDNNAQFFVDEGQANISKLTDVQDDEALVYSPTTGLVGTPQQTDYGASFTLLLDPNVTIKKPAMKIKLDQSMVRQNLIRVGEIPTLLDQDGIYQVAALTHIGDTRGNDWYTRVKGISCPGKVPLLLETVNQSPN